MLTGTTEWAATMTDLPEAAPPDHFDEYQLVFLWSARDRVKLDDSAADRLHLGHLEAMRDASQLLVAGPLFGQPDPRLRGICIYRTESNAKASELAASDPAVRAGQLEIEVMGSANPPGRAPGRPEYVTAQPLHRGPADQTPRLPAPADGLRPGWSWPRLAPPVAQLPPLRDCRRILA